MDATYQAQKNDDIAKIIAAGSQSSLVSMYGKKPKGSNEIFSLRGHL